MRKYSPIFKWMAPAVLVFTLGCISGCDRLRSFTEQELIQRAKTFELNGDDKSAVIELKNALQKNPNNVEARWLLGEIYIRTGQANEAEKELLKARQLGLNPASITAQLAQALLLQGKYDQVLETTRIPNNQLSNTNQARLLFVRGEALLGLNRAADGCSEYKQSLHLDPRYVPAYWGMAKCALIDKSKQQAYSYLEKALAIDGNNADTWFFIGNLRKSDGAFEKAEEAYGKALKINPSHIQSLMERAGLFLTIKDYSSAKKDIDNLNKQSPRSPLVKYIEALSDFIQGNYVKARTELQEALKVMPDHDPSLFLLAEISYQLGSYEQVETTLGRLLAKYPENMVASKLLAATLLKTQRAEKALELLKPFLDKEPLDSGVMRLAGDAALALNDFQTAVTYFSKAVQLDPHDSLALTGLGVSKLAIGQVEQGITDLRSAANRDKNNTRADLVLILTYLERKQYDNALNVAQALSKKQPKSPVAYNLMGIIYAEKNDRVNARINLEQAIKVEPTFIASAKKLAEMDLQDNNFEAAHNRFKRILAKDSNNLEAMLALTQLYMGAHKEVEAIRWAENAAKSNPTAIQPRKLLIGHYLQNNGTQRALSIANETFYANRTSPEALRLLGDTQLRAGENENAIASFVKLINLIPTDVTGYLDLARAQIAAQKYNEAKETYKKGLKVKPDFLQTKLELAQLELRTGKHSEAARVAREIQTAFPKMAIGFELEGDVLFSQHQYEKALQNYEKASAMLKNESLLSKLHRTAIRAGQSGKVYETRLLSWLKEHPEDISANIYLAEYFAASGKNELAIDRYQQILKRAPRNLLALNNLATLYQKGNNRLSLSFAEQAYKIRPESPSIVDTYGMALLQFGDPRQAIEVLKKGVQRSPERIDVRYHLAVALARSGDHKAAQKELAIVLGSTGKFPEREEAEKLQKELAK